MATINVIEKRFRIRLILSYFWLVFLVLGSCDFEDNIIDTYSANVIGGQDVFLPTIAQGTGSGTERDNSGIQRKDLVIGKNTSLRHGIDANKNFPKPIDYSPPLVLVTKASNVGSLPLGLQKNTSLYDHAEFKIWREGFIAGNLEQVIQSVENNLNSSNSHPLADFVWVITHKVKGDLQEALKSAPPAFKNKVVLTADLVELSEKDFYSQLIEKYSYEEIKEHNTPYRAYLWGDNISNIDQSLQYEIILHSLQNFGETFRQAWSLLFASESRAVVFQRLQEDLTKGTFDSYPATKSFLMKVNKHRPGSAHDKLAAVELFLEIQPMDAIAMRYKASILKSLERYDHAAEWYEKALQADPFYYPGGNISDKTYCYAKTHRYTDAKKESARAAKMYHPNKVKIWQEVLWSRALISSGDYGTAMVMLENARKKYPKVAEIQYQSGRVENSMLRYNHALAYFKSAIKLNPDNLIYRKDYIGALHSAKKLELALEEFAKLESKVEQLNLALYDLKADILESAEEFEEANAVRQSSVKDFPNSSWMLRALAWNYSKSGKNDQALTLMYKAIVNDQSNSWAFLRFSDFLNNKYPDNKEQLLKELAALATKYPWNEYIWESIADNTEGTEQKIAVWKRAQEVNPNNLMPLENLRRIMNRASQWDDWLDLLEASEDGISNNGSEADKVNIHFEKAIIIWQKMFKRRLSVAQLENAIVNFDNYLKAGGRAAAVYNYQSDLYDALGDKEKAAELITKALKIRPDVRSYATTLVTKYGAPNSISYLYDWMMRNPYSRAGKLAEISVKWGGSPISALSTMYRYDVDDSWVKSKAFELLGNSAKIYEDYYVNKSSLGHERYIGWYNAARHSAWDGSTQLEIDYKTNTATILFEDGTIAQRQDDIRSGKIRRIQVGDTWVTADYTDNGDLTKLETSAGKKIELIYSVDDKISSLTSSDGQQLRFTYNEGGEITEINMKGVGSMVIDYDEDGTLLSTKSFNESGEQGGSSLALVITQAFQELIGLTKILKNGYDLSSGSLPNLGIEDLNYNRLSANNYAALDAIYNKDDIKSRLSWLKTSLALAEYLSEHTYMDAGYGYEAAAILKNSFSWIKENNNKKIQKYGVEVIAQFHKLLLKIRKQGVAMDYWNDWIDMQEWLQLEKKAETKLTDYRKSIERLQEHTNALQIELLATAEWLPKSILQNDGYWQQFSLSAVIPRVHREGVKLNCMLYRDNGDLVLGTSKGLSVYRSGYWEWFGYNGIRSEWQTELSTTKLKGTSDIRALAETGDGTLLIGTPEGLLNIKGDYRGKQSGRIIDGLPSPLVSNLMAVEDRTLVGTTKGAVWYSDGELEMVENLPNDVEIVFMSYSLNLIEEEYFEDDEDESYYDEYEDYDEYEGYYDEDGNWVEYVYDEEGNIIEEIVHVKYIAEEDDDLYNEIPQKILIGTNQGVFVASGRDAFSRITSTKKDAGYIGSDGRVYLLKGDEVTRIDEITELQAKAKEVEINLFGSIVTSQAKGVYGLVEIPVNEGENALAVLTDLGFSIYHNNHFEHFYLPEKQKAKGLINSANNSFAGWSDESVWIFEKENIKISPGHIYDIVSADSLGITFVADGGSLKFIYHNDPDGNIMSSDYYGSTTSLALDANNRIIANDGLTIYRYTYNLDTESFKEEELFYANQYEPTTGEKYRSGRVKNIQVAKDGTIWVTTKMSIFQYREDENGEGVTQEFNYFRDSDRFPARTHMVYRLLETLAGKILVVGSNEGHLYQSGVSLKGGLLQWVEDEGRFIRLNTDDLDFNWVIHSYTAISETEAIIGTTAGFARDKNGYIEDYRNTLKDPSYLSLFDQHQNLFLGTKGARLGDLWLFGAGAGVVAYQEGNWFYPDRINQMLPKDLELRNYGSRHVNAIATDPQGKVYVGTDLGLLVYNSGGATPMSFLLNNYREQDAFAYHSSNKVMQERDVLLDGINQSTSAGKIIARLNVNAKETRRLEKIYGKSKSNITMSTIDLGQELNSDSLTTLIDNKQKQHIELLLQLEQADPGIHQLMNIQPVEIASMRKRFAADECLVQFIPTKQKLFIQLLANNKLVMREVNIGQDSLMRLCRATANYISMEINDERMLKNLEVLYDNLLRPVADDLGDYEKVFIVPALSIYYVPFAALVNRVSEREFRYAIEDFNFGYVSSTNLLSLLFEGGKNKAQSILLMGDADGSLPAAQEEVKEIGKLVPDKIIFTEKDVTLQNLIINAKNARIIHLATHGYLNERTPNKSNILLAMNKRLTLPEAFNLPLDNTEMVVLSACQTARGGGSGLEYATIARAFTNAGASTVLATLWKVNDRATKDLMVKFYGHLLDGTNIFTALAKAQRELILSDDEFLMHPHRWASFIPMGMP